MRYWWVNQNQTYRQEIHGGYLWSPQRKSNNARNPFYETMREVAPGDIVFSFYDTRIQAVGVARSFCYECPKPDEFGDVGQNWDRIGWRVDVRWTPEPIPLRPKEHMDVLRPLLPERYAPLRPNGDGLQSIYLTELSYTFAQALAQLMGRPILDLIQRNRVTDTPHDVPERPDLINRWEEQLQYRIQSSETIPRTTKAALIAARRGQGLFRQNVQRFEYACRITHVDRLEHLRASHCKPWRDSNEEERLDGENGLLLTPSIDHLFDRGFISFEDNGDLLISPVSHRRSLIRMGVPDENRINVGAFTTGQKKHLDFHREKIFLARR